jgi:amino acid adenylation domain-containing protein
MSHTSFLEPIARNAVQYGSNPAFSTGNTKYSYKEFFAIARGIHDEIVRLGYGDAKRIGIVAGDSVHTSASTLSIWSIGAAFVSLNVHYPADRNARIIEEAGLELILTSRPGKEWPKYLPQPAGTFRLLHTHDIEPGAEPVIFPRAEPSDLAYLFFTSGSTGQPKGVPITHSNLSAFMNTYISGMGYDFSAEDRFLQMFALTFDLSVVSTLAPLSVGGCCCAIPQKGIAYMNIMNVLAKQNVTVALMVPSVLPYLRRFFGELRFPSMRLSQFCGEALMQDIASEWSQCVPNARIENVYGPTEATIFCTRYSWSRERAEAESVNGIVPIGKAMPGTSAYVVDDDGRLCRDGERGELCLAGDQVMAGYWNDREKTAESFVTLSSDGKDISAYRTGDIVYVNEHADLAYCGRKDSQVKIDGHRVELGEIEHFARLHLGGPGAAAVLVKDTSGIDRLRLFVGGEDIDRSSLETYLKAQLPDYMWPSAITVLPELPLNLNGKIDRPALAKLP